MSTTVWQAVTGDLPILSAFAQPPFESESYNSYEDNATLGALVPGLQDPGAQGSNDDEQGPVCFAPGTRIALFGGSRYGNKKEMAIEQLKPGMCLVDGNNTDKFLVVRRVFTVLTQRLLHLSPGLVGARGIYVTPRHLVFDPAPNKWVEAREIKGARPVITRFQPMVVYHVETDRWGACLAEGIRCETAAVSDDAKHARTAVNHLGRRQ